jgi:hypothetical protein
MKRLRPTRKVSVGALSGALTALSFWLVETLWGLRLPAGAEALFSALFGFVVSWLVPDRFEET